MSGRVRALRSALWTGRWRCSLHCGGSRQVAIEFKQLRYGADVASSNGSGQWNGIHVIQALEGAYVYGSRDSKRTAGQEPRVSFKAPGISVDERREMEADAWDSSDTRGAHEDRPHRGA